ncbi:hypothetical protein VOLCADRAFT_93031 [Volvox carteri f. nagariensis]|uniref:Potassium channel tetramerisation-type BTB domain-containing protein n=1 Tax=Volvox carteri f. nagariensis TaxID=3068 RepID=D8U159_VOLCA|nr:uncharacterized protein VOLCADRAFT_93031 [Volvox carteri f. nagariensis]EFJ46575.1 hypothetical protein VOLCADRAFT_93031 [Volvox carteri f. nagariensis]|eukprot:XP_002952432.1 hypothetical protein VOLCADRAFT_93031 [Volvox carteri f. nagariensis]
MADGSGVDNDLSIQFQLLSAAMEARMRQLNQQEEQIRQAEAALSAASQRMASLSARMQSDLIPLNVGGTQLATSRRTLTLVPDSLLGTMFSGSWDDHLQRDDAGRVFLDYDPSIFSLLLNWLRSQDMGGPEVPLWELAVEPAREEQLLVLIDFLQLQRYVPCRFTESFSPSLSSPFLTLSSSSAWRTSAGCQGAYAMAATSHCYFDVDVDLSLEIIRFGAVTRPEPLPSRRSSDSGGSELPNYPMFIGVMARGQLAAVDQSRKKSNASWQSSCHGWYTRRKEGCEVRAGKNRRLQSTHFWAEGDFLVLSLDAAKHPGRTGAVASTGPTASGRSGQSTSGDGSCANGRAAADAGPGAVAAHSGPVVTLSLTNTRTRAQLQLDIPPTCLGGFEEQWVVVVGLSGRGDEVRVNSARRKGMKPHMEAVTAARPPDGASAAPTSVGAGVGAGIAGGAGDLESGQRVCILVQVQLQQQLPPCKPLS